MNILLGLAILILAIFVHELGHYLAARMCKVPVITFCVGFGPRLFTKKIGNTFYALAILPFGGFAIPLMRSTPNPENQPEIIKKILGWLLSCTPAEEAWADELVKSGHKGLMDRGVFSQLTVLFAGSFFNFLLAFFTSFFTVYYLVSYHHELFGLPIAGITANSPAAMAELKKWDILESQDGIPITSWEMLWTTLQEAKDKPLKYKLRRYAKNSDTAEVVTVTLAAQKAANGFYSLGVSASTFPRRRIGIGEAVYISLDSFFAGIISLSKEPVNKLVELNGPVEAASKIGVMASECIARFVETIIGLNLMLALFNLLPVPALDGGQISYVLIEKVLRIPLSQKLKQVMNTVVLASLLGIMMLGIVKDAVVLFS